MFRDRTNLFLSYRRTFPHNRQPTLHDSASFYDIEGNGEESHPMIDMTKSTGGSSSGFLELTNEMDVYIKGAEARMVQLAKLYRKNSLPGFEDKASDEQEIEDLSYSIIQLFQKSFAIVKSLESIKSEQVCDGQTLTRGDIMVLDNLQKKYANKIQLSSNKFRLLQNNYLKFLNKDDFKPLPRAASDADTLIALQEDEKNSNTQQEIDSYSRLTLQRQTQRQAQGRSSQYLQQREQEITQLARGVLEVSSIFREMQDLVVDQGTIIDRIDYNLENTVLELKGAQRELDRATVYQTRSQKCKVILLLSLVVIALFIVVMLKPNHHASKLRPGDSGSGETGQINDSMQEASRKRKTAAEEVNNSS